MTQLAIEHYEVAQTPTVMLALHGERTLDCDVAPTTTVAELLEAAKALLGYDPLGALTHPDDRAQAFWNEFLRRLTEPTDERSYVSRLWAEDWDSPEDAGYDER